MPVTKGLGMKLALLVCACVQEISKKKKNAKKAVPVKYTVDCSKPAGDSIFDTAAFEKYVHDRVKVDGRTNNLGSTVSIVRNGASLTITAAPGTVAKRYVKYLTKKYLKKTIVSEWLRVVAVSKTGYELRYRSLNIDDDAAEEDDE
ncbi:50S ribosomal protein L22e [Chytriomyces cf. hyalinus JEL632]|nr:50S ribosomal protein L22e [Chytriomyces cf. hyalinus JEL632]